MARYTVVDKTKKGKRNYYTVKDKKTNTLGVYPTEVIKEEITKGNIDNMAIKSDCLVFIEITNPFVIINSEGKKEFNAKYVDFFVKAFDFKGTEIVETEDLKKMSNGLDSAHLEGSFVAPSWNPNHGGDPGDSPELVLNTDGGNFDFKINIDNKKIIEKACRINGYRFNQDDGEYEDTLYLFATYVWEYEYTDTFDLVHAEADVFVEAEEHSDCISYSEGDYDIVSTKRIEDAFLTMSYSMSIDEDALYEKLADEIDNDRYAW